jgi:rhomboid protease GluP
VNDPRNSSYPGEPPAGPGTVSVRLPSGTPYVVYGILALTVFVYILQFVSEAFLGTDLPVVFGAKINELIRAGQLWRLITPVLLHGSLLHIGFNMYALLIFGTNLEQRYGPARFLMLYLLGGFSGNVLSFLLSSGISVGASTAVFGLIAAEGIFLYQHREMFGGQARRALGNIVTIAGINLLLGLQPGIDNWGHIGGLLGGLIFAWFSGPRWQVAGIYPQLNLQDQREGQDLVLGAALVLLVFGTLAAVGMYFPIVP